jgi:PAS domain S-box-containing protein
MSHINDIQRRPDAKAIIPFLIYIGFLVGILIIAIQQSWNHLYMEVLLLPVCLAMPWFKSRVYFLLLLIFAITVIGFSYIIPIIQISNTTLFTTLALIAFSEIIFLLNTRYKQCNKKLSRKIDTRIERLSALRRIDLSMISNNPLPDTLAIIVKEIKSHFQLETVNIYIINRNTNHLTWQAGDYPPVLVDSAFPLNRLADTSQNNKSLVLVKLNRKMNQNPQMERMAKDGYRVYLGLPLWYNHILLGIIEIFSKQDIRPDNDFIDYLEMLGGQTAIAIEHATSLSHLQEINDTLQSTVEELTETKETLEKSQRIGRIGSWRYKLETGKIAWTQVLFDMHGLDPKKMQPTYKKLLSNINPDDIDNVRNHLDALLKGENIYELEYRVHHPSGENRNLIAMGEAYFDESGKVVEIIGTVRDRTEHKQAELQIHEAHMNLQQSYDSTLEGWARALELRDHDTEGHSQRVARLCLQLAEILEFPEEELIHLRRGAILHDIGKIGIPDTILLKPEKLTPEEWEIMRQHPQFAYDMLSPISYLQNALDIPYCHHEKWDGTGYPQGLKGEEIPLSARIFTIVDVLDALLSDRPYRDAWTLQEAKEYIIQQSGTHFDPAIVETLIKNWNRIIF